MVRAEIVAELMRCVVQPDIAGRGRIDIARAVTDSRQAGPRARVDAREEESEVGVGAQIDAGAGCRGARLVGPHAQVAGGHVAINCVRTEHVARGLERASRGKVIERRDGTVGAEVGRAHVVGRDREGRRGRQREHDHGDAH